ncbi:MAG TPA: V-type ATP synthase subunit B [Anaerolineae bacterium]|nr:V-type ATP synthase subunit B [Anaerolineae bacterium]
MAIAEYGWQEIAGAARVEGPIVVIEGVSGVGYDEVAEIVDLQGRVRRGRVLEVGEGVAVVEVFAGTTGLSIEDTHVRFLGRPMRLPVSTEMLGRVFDGLGTPIDGGPEPLAERWADVNGQPINPTARVYPRDIIQTGISALDGMNSLVLGQKLPIFSGSGLPHDQLAAQIVRQATVRQAQEGGGETLSGGEKEGGETLGVQENPKGRREGVGRFAIVFAAMGVKHDVAEFFRESFAASGALTRVAMFLNLADDPPIERLVTPHAALTLAEFLAFERNMHVLVVLTDMTNYCEALRQISNIRGEVPSRKGYPGYLYSDLAALYERTGRIKGSSGSITQLPILTMPNDDITHPVPDLTGYITEGQIVLSRGLFQRGIYPPIDVLPCLSRLMKDSIGEGHTRADHAHLSAQLYAAYAHVQDVRALASVIGEEELTTVDQSYLKFGDAFERDFVGQGTAENRTIEDTLDIGWRELSILPREELTRVTEAEIEKYYRS